jgi:hypothetical protein
LHWVNFEHLHGQKYPIIEGDIASESLPIKPNFLHYRNLREVFLQKTQQERRGCTLEKLTIIDEVFAETFIQIEDFADMKIESIMDYQKPLDVCPKCKKVLEEIYCRSRHTGGIFDLLVLECPGCKSYFSYWVEESDCYSEDDFDPNEERANPTAHAFPLEHSDSKRLPKKCAEAFSKAVAIVENKNKELDLLILEKKPQLCKAGLSPLTICYARNKVAAHLTSGKPTPKGLAKLAAGAIYATANGVSMKESSILKHQGEGITEEKLEEIFGVTRKTIRKWAKFFC